MTFTWRGPNKTQVGKQFRVTIDAQAARPVSRLSFTVGYDPSTLTVVHVAEGDLFKQHGTKTIFTSKVDPATGHAFLYVSRVGPRGVSGKGSLAIVTFSAQAARSKSPIVISGANIVSSAGTELPPPTSSPLIVNVEP